MKIHCTINSKDQEKKEMLKNIFNSIQKESILLKLIKLWMIIKKGNQQNRNNNRADGIRCNE